MINEDKIRDVIDEAIHDYRSKILRNEDLTFTAVITRKLISNNILLRDWIAADQKPDKFVSVLGHMTDAGDFPAVRECYWTGESFFFPALCERHPVDRWMEMPE